MWLYLDWGQSPLAKTRTDGLHQAHHHCLGVSTEVIGPYCRSLEERWSGRVVDSVVLFWTTCLAYIDQNGSSGGSMPGPFLVDFSGPDGGALCSHLCLAAVLGVLWMFKK